MMDPAWPKRIAYGHADGQPENDEKMGFSERRIAQRFWPTTKRQKLPMHEYALLARLDDHVFR
jgi:hypothetical protein